MPRPTLRLPPAPAALRPAEGARGPAALAELAALAGRLAERAWTDAETGLVNRRHAAVQLEQALRGPGVALVALRAADAAAEWRRARAEMLGAYPRHVAGAFVAALGAGDLLLCLPVPGLAAETAATLLQTLRRAGDETGFVVAAAEAGPGADATRVLADLASALGQAQSGSVFQLDLHAAGAVLAPADRERSWRGRVERALADGRCRLGWRPALDAAGAVPMALAPLWVQPADDAGFEAGTRCLSSTARRRLQPQLDAAAVRCALQALAGDARPRCVRLDTGSLSTPGFIDGVAGMLQARPRAAHGLVLMVGGGVAPARLRARLRAAAAAWGAAGVRLGLDPGVLGAADWPLLGDTGLSLLRLDGRLLRGAAAGTALQDALRGLVRLAHALGWQVLLDAPAAAPDDLGAMWAAAADLVVTAPAG